MKTNRVLLSAAGTPKLVIYEENNNKREVPRIREGSIDIIVVVGKRFGDSTERNSRNISRRSPPRSNNPQTEVCWKNFPYPTKKNETIMNSYAGAKVTCSHCLTD